jgi:hypothetical protein
MLVGALAGLAVPTTATAATARPSSCFWEGPISTHVRATDGFDGKNFNFPEAAATYWFARVHLPAGARVVLHGHYARARYPSLNAYNSGGEPVDALRDTLIKPDAGATNPYIAGHGRFGAKRGYTVNVAAGVVRPALAGLTSGRPLLPRRTATVRPCSWRSSRGGRLWGQRS